MPHLAVMRKGWENERMAAFLLSQIAFVAHPLAIADDIGSDFFCTLFEPVEKKGAQQLFPLNSFAIQIKSNRRAVSATKKIGYFSRLELPFFLGVIDHSGSSLSLYSGEFIPMMFSRYGIPRTLKLRPFEKSDVDFSAACTCTGEKNCDLKLPSVTKFSVGDSTDTISPKAQCLGQLCLRMHANISTWKLDEYVFRLRQADQVQIMAGPGSAKTFRRNFYLRLAEVFYNLEWLLDHRSSEFSLPEFEMYERMYIEMVRRGIELPEIVTIHYQQLKKLLHN